MTPPRPTVVPDAPVDTLAHLVQRASVGDLEAFGELYDATAGPVYGLALKVLGDEDLACDVVRRAFAEVWAYAPSWTPAHGPVSAWIVATTHRLAVAHVRTHGTALTVGPSDTDPVLDGLDLDDQHAVRLVYFGGRTVSQVAHASGTTGAVVAGRLASALRVIRDAARRDDVA